MDTVFIFKILLVKSWLQLVNRRFGTDLCRLETHLSVKTFVSEPKMGNENMQHWDMQSELLRDVELSC